MTYPVCLNCKNMLRQISENSPFLICYHCSRAYKMVEEKDYGKIEDLK